jgi:hypothetical protein
VTSSSSLSCPRNFSQSSFSFYRDL